MTDQPRSEPRIPIRAKLAEQLQERVSKYREQRDNVASSLKRDPEHPAREKQENREVVTAAIETLAALWREFMPYIRRIKPLAGDILEPSRLSAFYFLFGKVSNGLDAIFVLAREGFYYEVMEIIRSNGEALDLVVLFQQESADGRLMKKWFEGEIIENAKAREAFDPLIGETARCQDTRTCPTRHYLTRTPYIIRTSTSIETPDITIPETSAWPIFASRSGVRLSFYGSSIARSRMRLRTMRSLP